MLWWWLYLLIGPGAWLALWVLALFARTRMDRLERDKSPLPDPAPSLAIVVPARNESEGIVDCLTRLMQQDYPRFDLIAVNDRSTDDTGQKMAGLGRRAEGFKSPLPSGEGVGGGPSVESHNLQTYSPITIEHLPEGWLGKCHALHVATRGLTQEWLLFVDSDVSLNQDAARRAVSLAQSRNYDVLSILPKLHAPTFKEQWLLPILAAVWAGAFRISQTNDDSKPHVALANGQFLLVRREWYEKVDGHRAVKDRIVEDVELMRLLKQSGASVRFMTGTTLGQTRMHSTWKQIYHGWARIFLGTARNRLLPIVGVTLFMIATTFSLVPALAVAIDDRQWVIPVVAHGLLMLGLAAYAYSRSGNRVWPVVLFPITIVMILSVLIFTLYKSRSRRLDWRGTTVRA